MNARKVGFCLLFCANKQGAHLFLSRFSYFFIMSNSINTLLEELLTKVLRQTVTIISAKPLGGGCINHAMHLTTSTGDFFAKWNDQPPANLFVREAESLTELAKACTLLMIPRVVVAKPLDKQPAMLITELKAISTKNGN